MEPWESFRTLVPSTFAILGTIGNEIWKTYYTKIPFMERNLFDCRDAFTAHTGATTEGFLICAPFSQVGLTAGPRSRPQRTKSWHGARRGYWRLCLLKRDGIRLWQFRLPESIVRNAEAYITILWYSNSTLPNTELIPTRSPFRISRYHHDQDLALGTCIVAVLAGRWC
jgi:hypothetical protein